MALKERNGAKFLRTMLKPGTIIGGTYCVRYLIAEGGMSEVYLAESCLEAQRYAIKRILPKLAHNPLFLRLFTKEAHVVSLMNHPNIVTCCDFITEGHDLFMVMEYVAGKEVGVVNKSLKNPPRAHRIKLALALGWGVGEALLYVHDKQDMQGRPLGIVHGDISPQNIMIDADGAIKIFDFGAFNDAYSDRTVVQGNFRYMSPEQKLGCKIDARSDMYSLCLVMLETMFYDIMSTKSLDQQFCKTIIHNGFKNDFLMADFFHRGLHENPTKRFDNSAEMHRECLAISRHYGVKNHQETLKEVLQDFSYAPKYGRHKKYSHEERRVLVQMMMIILLVFSILALSVTYFSKLFEPKYQHNIPYWSEGEITKDDKTFKKSHFGQNKNHNGQLI